MYCVLWLLYMHGCPMYACDQQLEFLFISYVPYKQCNVLPCVTMCEQAYLYYYIHVQSGSCLEAIIIVYVWSRAYGAAIFTSSSLQHQPFRVVMSV